MDCRSNRLTDDLLTKLAPSGTGFFFGRTRTLDDTRRLWQTAWRLLNRFHAGEPRLCSRLFPQIKTARKRQYPAPPYHLGAELRRLGPAGSFWLRGPASSSTASESSRAWGCSYDRSNRVPTSIRSRKNHSPARPNAPTNGNPRPIPCADTHCAAPSGVAKCGYQSVG
jgi:hypothetical protein